MIFTLSSDRDIPEIKKKKRKIHTHHQIHSPQ